MVTRVAVMLLLVLSQTPLTVTVCPAATADRLEVCEPCLKTVALVVFTVWLPRSLLCKVKLDPLTAVTVPTKVPGTRLKRHIADCGSGNVVAVNQAANLQTIANLQFA